MVSRLHLGARSKYYSKTASGHRPRRPTSAISLYQRGIEFNLNADRPALPGFRTCGFVFHYPRPGKAENRYRLTSFRAVILFGHRRFTFLRTRTIVVRPTHTFTLFTFIRSTLTVLRTAGPQGLTRTRTIVRLPDGGIATLPIGTVTI